MEEAGCRSEEDTHHMGGGEQGGVTGLTRFHQNGASPEGCVGAEGWLRRGIPSPHGRLPFLVHPPSIPVG